MARLLTLFGAAVVSVQASCRDSTTWHKVGDPVKDCAWAAGASTRLPGVLKGTTRTKVVVGQDVDWPPYAYIGTPPESDYGVAGFGHDIAMGMAELCDIDFTFVQADWADCWDDGKIGPGLLNGYYHACATYTHTTGERPRQLEFSHAILDANKPAGILTRIDSDGVPAVSGMSDLSGKTIVDVIGWAPTADGLALVTNQCTGEPFTEYTIISPTVVTGEANDNALASSEANDKRQTTNATLLNGDADAMWVYADQAENYDCGDVDADPTWDCDLWAGFGTTFAYVQTGLSGHSYNGTTLTIAKKGSGLAEAIINPCLDKYIYTEAYFDVCEKHGLTASCYRNDFFPEDVGTDVVVPELPTDEQAGPCSSGYCACS
ncbi:hypothetical protein M885DRAFT_594199 [Pelagophyceae sp. CCMP2097]|nr:hypothetical protein M885DRAFT_594199 [Pelagophyceae sp. CCMP2097]